MNINGNAFNGSSITTRPGHGTVYFHIHNNDCEWVDVEIKIDDDKQWNSGHIQPGQQKDVQFPLGKYAGRTIKHCRWRPGFLGAGGTGGGDAFWTCPTSGDVIVTLNLQKS